ncbi:glycoside hydrolase [Marichromatium purpuratum 984]|uniref:Glycoside hydrolase n=1 Tax=Marichromatium purpuratum 984 TaxID=765910 RepID=W0E4D4_MARPU|nr:C40 family peptidase [Marichromatium purpuratum]AHF04408.1 glycoside hydrolase [Marichromatium purpuratum 984]
MRNEAVSSSVRVGILAALVLLGGCAATGGARQQVVEAGLAQLGTPYRYGGTDPRTGVDCSGLTYYAHHAAGIDIPRVSVAQLARARPLAQGRARAGDLVFFRTGPGVHHVGLMVDDERFVHASTSRREVRLARLDAPYWRARYLGAGTYLD